MMKSASFHKSYICKGAPQPGRSSRNNESYAVTETGTVRY